MGCFLHLFIISHHLQWYHHGVGTIHLVMLMFNHLVLVLVMVEVVLVLRPPTFPPTKNYCWLDGGDFVSSKSMDYPSMKHYTKDRYFSLFSRRRRTNLALLVMVEVVLFLGRPTSHPIKLISTYTSMMMCFGYLRIIGHNTLWYHFGVRIIHFVLLVVLQLVFLVLVV